MALIIICCTHSRNYTLLSSSIGWDLITIVLTVDQLITQLWLIIHMIVYTSQSLFLDTSFTIIPI